MNLDGHQRLEGNTLQVDQVMYPRHMGIISMAHGPNQLQGCIDQRALKCKN